MLFISSVNQYFDRVLSCFQCVNFPFAAMVRNNCEIKAASNIETALWLFWFLTTRLVLLYGWARDIAVWAVYTAVTGFGLEEGLARSTFIKPLACVSGHGFFFAVPAFRAGNCWFSDKVISHRLFSPYHFSWVRKWLAPKKTAVMASVHNRDIQPIQPIRLRQTEWPAQRWNSKGRKLQCL